MHPRNIERQFGISQDLGFENLVVSGCSFTYNNSETQAVAWPYYLRDLANINTVHDLSVPGAGNNHINASTICFLDSNPHLSSTNTLVLICLSGNDRDDFLVTPSSTSEYPVDYEYAKGTVLGLSGGDKFTGNLPQVTSVQKWKDKHTRALENYIAVRSLYTYLSILKCKFVLFQYRDYTLPALDNSFDLLPYLPTNLAANYRSMVHDWSEDLYSFCLKKDLIEEDDYHPSPNGHLRWTREILLPELESYIVL